MSASASAVPDEGLHHIAGVYDGERMQLFVDGELVREEVGDGSVAAASTPVSLGQLEGGAARFPGSIRHLRISDVARSSGWIRAAAQNMLSPREFVQTDV